MQQGRSGAAFLAYRANASVVLVVITGQENLFPSLRRLRRARVRVVFAPPFDPLPIPAGHRAGTTEVRAFTEEIMYRMAAMLPPEYRGQYADVEDKRPDLMAQCATHG
jgi:1-acyl-sn-glycerol-3-phosphate acyltransferase